MKLYEIADNMKALEALIESGEYSIGELQDTIEACEGEFEEKLKACLMVRQQAQGNASALLKEVERIQALVDAETKKASDLNDYVKHCMLKAEKDKFDLGLFKLTLRKAAKKLGDIDESKVPEKYFIEVPATKKLDKRALLKDAKENDIEGVSVVDGERSLMVK